MIDKPFLTFSKIVNISSRKDARKLDKMLTDLGLCACTSDVFDVEGSGPYLVYVDRGYDQKTTIIKKITAVTVPIIPTVTNICSSVKRNKCCLHVFLGQL